jgi:hypothetical protein
MRCIEIAEALENGAKGSAINLNNAHNVPILKSDCANAVSYAVNCVIDECSCNDGKSLRQGKKGAQ